MKLGRQIPKNVGMLHKTAWQYLGQDLTSNNPAANHSALAGAYHMVADLITYVLAPIMTALAFVL
eukprot:1155650-Pelagomonas_calceolata.AAC.3